MNSTAIRRWSSALIGLLLAVTNTYAQRLPTDTELQAAYCIAIVDNHIHLFEAAVKDTITGQYSNSSNKAELRKLAEQGLAEANDRKNRIVAYLIPKANQIDVAGIAAARQRGDADVAYGNTQLVYICSEKCKDLKDTASAMACYQECAKQDERNKRMSRCSQIDWLPF